MKLCGLYIDWEEKKKNFLTYAEKRTFMFQTNSQKKIIWFT